MKSRLERYKQFIEKQYIQGLTRNKDYSLDYLKKELEKKIKNKQFKRIIFTGMGCSAIVSDMIKGFFIYQNIPIQIEVVNDYDIGYFVDKEVLKESNTLVIISSYSGYSKEPINAYMQIKKLTKNIIFLTSGGELEKIGIKEGVSVINWKLKNPDREYPLFHVPQYFSIFLDIFHKLGMLESNYKKELIKTAEYLKKEFNNKKLNQAKEIANKLRDRDIVLLASPKWHFTLLKIVKMHLNEIAMAPAHRNLVHEFTHSEVAVFTSPKIKHALIIFKDKNEDRYTREKIKTLENLISENKSEKINVSIMDLNQDNFFNQFFFSLFSFHYITYYLGSYYNVKSRELISRAAGNPWYNIKTINLEGKNK